MAAALRKVRLAQPALGRRRQLVPLWGGESRGREKGACEALMTVEGKL